MFCPFCGKEIPNDAMFCGHCGKRLDSVPASAPMPEPIYTPTPHPSPEPEAKPASGGSVFRILLGVLFLLPSLIYPFMNGWMIGDMLTQMHIASYGANHIAAYSILNMFTNLVNNFTLLPTALVSVVIGIALLQNRSGAGKIAVLGAVFHILTALAMLLAVVLYPLTPHFFFGLYSVHGAVTDAGLELLRNNFAISMRFVLYGLPVALVSAVVAALSIVFAVIHPKNHPELPRKMDRGAFSLALFVFLFFIFNYIGTLFTSLIIGQTGNLNLSGYGFATNILSMLNALSPLRFIFLLTLVMLGHKWWYWLQTVPAAILLAVSAVALILFIPVTAKAMYIPDDIYEYTTVIATMELFQQLFLLLGYLFWAAASARRAVPVWLQFIVLLLIPLYTFLIYMQHIGLHVFFLPLAGFVTMLVLLVASIICVLVAWLRKKKTVQA